MDKKVSLSSNLLFCLAGTLLGFVITIVLFPPGGENDTKNWELYPFLPPLMAALFVCLKVNILDNYFIAVLQALVIVPLVSFSYVFFIKNGIIPFLFGFDLLLYIIFGIVALKTGTDYVLLSCRKLRVY